MNYKYNLGETVFYEFKPYSVKALGDDGSVFSMNSQDDWGDGEGPSHGISYFSNELIVPATPDTERYSKTFQTFFHEEISGLSMNQMYLCTEVPLTRTQEELHSYLASEWLKVCNEENSEKAEARMAEAFKEAKTVQEEEIAVVKKAQELVKQSQNEGNPSSVNIERSVVEEFINLITSQKVSGVAVTPDR